MKTQSGLIRWAISILLLLAVAGCGRNKSGAGDGGPIPFPDDQAVVHVEVSPNPADKLEVVTIDASGSMGTYSSFEFDFGDGSPVVTQASPVTTHVYDVVNYQDTTYTVRVRGFHAEGIAVGVRGLMIKDLPPSVAELQPGLDAKAVIGEWIRVVGKNFLTIPVITVDGQPVTAIELIDGENIRFRVPPASRAGLRNVTIQFTGYGPFQGELDIKRFAMATSARHDKVYLLDVAANEAITDTGRRLDVIDASVVKVSADGSTAYVNDGRFSFLANGTITIIDLTADGGPVVAGAIAAGNGPLFDIETAQTSPILVAGDSFGLTIFDVRDPLNPVEVGYTSVLLAGDPVNDIVTCDLAVSPNGTKIAALSALSHEARVFDVAGFTITNPALPLRVVVGTKAQDVAISDDGNMLYALGGGGEGAMPLDFSDPRAASLTAVSLQTGTVTAGPYKLSDLNANNPVARIPFDLTVSRSNPSKVYVTSVDEPFTQFFTLLQNAFNSFEDFLALVIFLSQDGLNLGKTIPVAGADGATPSLLAPMQETFTAPTSAELLYNDHRMIQSSFRLWYDDVQGEFVFETGVTAINLQAANASTYLPLTSEAISLDALFGLFQPPFHFGDVAFQP